MYKALQTIKPNKNSILRLSLLIQLLLIQLTLISCESVREKSSLAVDEQLISSDVKGQITEAEHISGIPGLYNFYRVDKNLYRSAQPQHDGFQELKKLGIKTIVNLRAIHRDGEECTGTGLECLQIQFEPWEPQDEEVIEFMKIVSDTSRQPILVHGKAGSDRTGMMVAIYRMAELGWSKEDAIEEMTLRAYGYSFFWSAIVDYINNLDIEKLRDSYRQ